jgi:hypothetical protein
MMPEDSRFLPCLKWFCCDMIMYKCNASTVYRVWVVLEMVRKTLLRSSPLSSLVGYDLRTFA